MPQPPLAELMQKTDALILFSRYETFGCVLIEANACGLPVLVSNLPVFYEIVHHGINGIISKENTHESLAQEMMSLIKNEYVFSNSEIAENAASLYNYEAIGKKFCEWYKKYT
jgi:glycosyltransferase involved in cell wall biosynthesis